MATPHSNAAGAEAADAVLRRLAPLADPPAGEFVDPERVAALGEGTLPPREEAAVLEQVRQSPSARVELRECFPEAYERLFGHEVPRDAAPAPEGKVIQGPWRRPAVLAGGGAVLLALAASLLVFLAPPAVPAGSELTVLRGVRSGVRGGETGVAIEPGEKIDLLMKLGAPTTLDTLRGAKAWGALVAVDPQGRGRIVCTHDDPECRASEKTMAYLFTAPREPGTTFFFFVASAEPVARGALERLLADLGPDAKQAAAALEVRLREAASEHRWQVHAHPPLVVGGL